jgi:hypothetical protein
MCYAIKFYSSNNDDFDNHIERCYNCNVNYKNLYNNNLKIICYDKDVCKNIFYYYKKYIKYKSKYLRIALKIRNNKF